MSSIFYCYATPTDIDTGHTVTFDSFVQSADIAGKPVAYRLAFDWQCSLRKSYRLADMNYDESDIDRRNV
jgi:hypothetical protein